MTAYGRKLGRLAKTLGKHYLILSGVVFVASFAFTLTTKLFGN